MDPWSSCLEEGARPQGLKVTSRDSVVAGDTGYTTNVEIDAEGNTLLAFQEWRELDGSWKLVSHETIPLGEKKPARGMLKCDSRVCVALLVQ